MKLIDKEALLLALRKKRYSKQSLDLIESQPTIEAIPVKWIRYQAFLHPELSRNLFYNMIIMGWEKENEKDI